MKARIRKIVTVVDETLSEQGRDVSPPIRRAAAVAVIANPFAGTYQEDLTDLIDIGEELGGLLAEAGGGGTRHRRCGTSRAMARRRRSARMASSNMPRPSCIPSSARRSARCWARARR